MSVAIYIDKRIEKSLRDESNMISAKLEPQVFLSQQVCFEH